MNTSQERFEEQFHQQLTESEGHQDETADESELQDEDPDYESESESGDEPEMSWSTTSSTQDRWIFTGEHGPAAVLVAAILSTSTICFLTLK
ncbi:unnamed protein product [Haemonchus placei]|uniref:CTNNB1_binding domain-containing protein n=1 Tax=Haemonchus placei TaxID=6290 RepID=A0A0N4WYQ6_HAEPC|nr:unnamed protein product [Haemonchus placei]